MASRESVAIACASRDDSRAAVEWRVTDTGIGIPRDLVGRLFADFAQADVSINRRFGGTGLGLAISRRIVEQMGGAIGVNSVAGVGTTFRFSLTLPWSDKLVSDQRTDRVGADDLKAGIAALGRPLRVLIAEDDATNRMVVVKMLQEFNAETRIATDGVQAVRAASEADYDLILMDVRMPEMDGLAATRAIRVTPTSGASGRSNRSSRGPTTTPSTSSSRSGAARACRVRPRRRARAS